MERLQMIRSLFFVYIGIIVLFNTITLPGMNNPMFQFWVSILVIIFILLMLGYMYSKRKIVWWSMVIFAGLGIIRPIIEFSFAQTFPKIANTIFPAFTPFFSVLGVITMIVAFYFLLNKKISKHFSQN